MLTVFNELKASGDILLSGISAFANSDYGEIAQSGIDAVQIPLNIFAWNQIENGELKKLHDAGMIVFVRIVYLQGLVFKDPDSLEPHMDFARDTLLKYRELCKKCGLSPAELAISYAFSLKEVTSLVLGCDTVDQVKANIELFSNAVELSEAQLAEIRQAFLNTDGRVLDPSLWNPKA